MLLSLCSFFSYVPLIGQLGFLVLAVMGAYYVWDANFDWHKAAHPSKKTFSISTLSDAELERFKTEVVRPGFEQACKAEALKTVGSTENYRPARRVSASALRQISRLGSRAPTWSPSRNRVNTPTICGSE